MFKKLGVQLFTVRSGMQNAQQIGETFRRLKALGYDEGQTAGCAVPYAEFAALAAAADFSIVGTHEGFDAMCADPETTMANHRLLGATNIGIGGYGFDSVEAVETFIQRANAFADVVYPHGFKFTYHNHNGEFRRLEGKTIMERLADGLDPVKTSFVLDTYWVQSGGGDVRYWMEKLAGRIDLLHLKDMKFENGQQICEIGQGNLYWDGIMETAEATGVKHYIVEQDNNFRGGGDDAFESLRITAEFLEKYRK